TRPPPAVLRVHALLMLIPLLPLSKIVPLLVMLAPMVVKLPLAMLSVPPMAIVVGQPIVWPAPGLVATVPEILNVPEPPSVELVGMEREALRFSAAFTKKVTVVSENEPL